MGTVTKTYTASSVSYTMTLTYPDTVKVSDSTFDVLSAQPTKATAYFNSSAYSSLDDVSMYMKNVRVFGSGFKSFKWSTTSSLAKNTTKTLGVTDSGGSTKNTSTYFNSSNPTVRSVPITGAFDGYFGGFYSGGHVSFSTPTYSVTWGNLVLDVPPTATVSAISYDTAYVYAGLTTASVTVTDATAYYGGAVDSVTLTIGNQTASISGNGTLSILLNAGGTFTPVVTVTDSRGQTKDYHLDDITVSTYAEPTIANIDAERTTNTGLLDDEGAHATITTTLTFDPISQAVAPTVAVTDENGNPQTATTTWYSSRASDGTLSGAVTWSTLPSGSTVYGLVSITGGFSTVMSYTIAITPTDSMGETGTVKTDTLQTAFYTVDFLAGGHGIAFGKPALQTGFWCDMDTHLLQGADVTGNLSVSGDADITGGLTVGSDTAITGDVSVGGDVDATGTIISDTNYEDAWSDTGQGYEVTGLSLAGSTYVKVDIDIGAVGVKHPIFNGFDIQGSGTARIHTLGHYVFQDNGHWYASVKMRNDNTSAISSYSVIAYIAWI